MNISMKKYEETGAPSHAQNSDFKRGIAPRQYKNSKTYRKYETFPTLQSGFFMLIFRGNV